MLGADMYKTARREEGVTFDKAAVFQEHNHHRELVVPIIGK